MLHLFIISMILAGGQLHVPHAAIALMILLVSILQLWKTILSEEEVYQWPRKMIGQWWSSDRRRIR